MAADNSPKKVGILGVGWLGFALAEALASAGTDLHAACTRLSKQQEVEHALKAPCFIVDLPTTTPQAFLNGVTDLVVTIPPGGRRFGERATANYLEQLHAIPRLFSSTPPPRIIFCSSTGVYGSATGEVEETTPVAPVTHSAGAVVAAERWLYGEFSDLVILRFAGLFGPNRHPGRFFGGKNFPVTRADAPVNLVDQRDAVAAIQLVIDTERAQDIYNVCAAAHPPKGIFYGAASEALHLPIQGLLPGGAESKFVNSDRIRALGWEPENDHLRLNMV